MSSSSADSYRRGRRPVHPDSPAVLRAADAAGLVSVRPARLDRQLSPAGVFGADDQSATLDRVYADPYLEDVLARAIEEAANLAREQARAEGFAAGWADGSRAAAQKGQAQREEIQRSADRATAQFERRTRSALSALDAAGRIHRQNMAVDLAEVGEAIAEGALNIAAWALGRELAVVDAEVAEAVRTALRALGTTDVSVVGVNPDDLLTLAELPADALPPGLQLDSDPGVPPGAALAISGSRQVLAHLPSALSRAKEVLQER